MGVVIKPMAEEHLDVVAVLEETCFGADAWPAEAFAELLEIYGESPDFRGQLWVAVEAGTEEVLGYAGLELSSLGEAELSNLAVSPAHRRQGVGQLLVAFVIGVCQELGVSLLWLRVRKSNTGAVDFYTTCGFRVRGEFRAYYDRPHEDALIMAVEIPEDTGEGT
jgi:ribosomal-protein-alanine N-acetyltransferase